MMVTVSYSDTVTIVSGYRHYEGRMASLFESPLQAVLATFLSCIDRLMECFVAFLRKGTDYRLSISFIDSPVH